MFDFFKSDDEKKSLIIECQNCETENKIKISSEIKCKNCNTIIYGNTTRFIKENSSSILIPFGIGIASGGVITDYNVVSSELIAVIGTGVTTYFFTVRAKLETEYKMMKKCIDRFGNTVEVRDNCFCVVKKLSSMILSLKIKDKPMIEKELVEKYNECKK